MDRDPNYDYIINRFLFEDADSHELASNILPDRAKIKEPPDKIDTDVLVRPLQDEKDGAAENEHTTGDDIPHVPESFLYTHCRDVIGSTHSDVQVAATIMTRCTTVSTCVTVKMLVKQ